MPDNLHRLIGELLADPAYATGRRSFPRTVSRDDAVGISAIVQREVDRATAAREEAAVSEGVRLACGRGCSYCCEELVLVFEAEALAIARWLARPENTAARARFMEAYPRWRTAVGDAPGALAELLGRGDEPGYRAAHAAQWRRRILCAFNVGGDCSIYPVRPVNCRNAHAVDTAERCRGDQPDGAPATRLAFVPLDQFLARARGLDRALHHALGRPRNRPQALCEAVHRLLAELGSEP
jgi:hypothetical protein